MRFITKQIYYSMQFYSYFLSGVDESELSDIDTQKEYQFYMKRDFNQFIYEFENVKAILFDKYNHLRDLDSKIYRSILEIAIRYNKYEKEQFSLLRESNKMIQNGNFPDTIKYLGEHSYHDCAIVDIDYKKKLLSIEFDDFSCNKMSRFIFKAKEFIYDIPWEELKNYEVLYKELLHYPEKNIFECNLLLIKWGKGEQANQIEDISILFSDIKDIIHKNY